SLWSGWQSFHVTTSPNHAPQVAAADYQAAHNAAIPASTLFSVADADNDVPTKYQFWDSTADASSGHFVVNGVAQGANQAIDVTAAQLAQTSFQSGSGADVLSVRAFDGIDWSPWANFTVTAPPDRAPTVTAADPQAVARNANLAVMSLFSTA